MSESLGLSIGVANLVAARVGSTPIIRRPVLTLFDHREAEVGLPEDNPNLTELGLVMRGFIERVGNRDLLMAADGTKYLGEALAIEALEAMARVAGYGSPIAIAFPAYWSPSQVTALRDEFFAQPGLVSDDVLPLLISDATAALATLRTKPGFPTSGVIALCDFGASGTSITVSNAGAEFQQIGSTVRHPEFSGDRIDQLVLNHIRTGAPEADTTDLAHTARIGAQARLLSDCRHAKEQLSAATLAIIPTGTPGFDKDVRLSRVEFEQIISGQLNRLITHLEQVLQLNGITRLGAVVTVGGGASIPLITSRFSERLEVPIFGATQPVFSAAIGAAVLGQQQSLSDGVTTTTVVTVDPPTDKVEGRDARTEVCPTARTSQIAGEPGVKSATYGAVAWSQDVSAEEPVPYVGPDYSPDAATTDLTRGFGDADEDSYYANQDPYVAKIEHPPWYKRPAVVLVLVTSSAAVLVAVVLALIVGPNTSKPTNSTTSDEQTPAPTSQTNTNTEANDSPLAPVMPPPPGITTPPVTPTTSQAVPTTTTTMTPPLSTTTTQLETTTPQTTSSEVTTTPPPSTTRRQGRRRRRPNMLSTA